MANLIVQEKNMVKKEMYPISFAEQASEMVYNADNYDHYCGVFRLVFEGFKVYEGIHTRVDIIETLELNYENELKQFYLDLLDAMDLDENAYRPYLTDFFTYNEFYSNVFYTKKFTVLNLIYSISENTDFRKVFDVCFDCKRASFDLSKTCELDLLVDTKVWYFFSKYEDMLNHLECDEKLESIVCGICYRIDYEMEVEYSKTLYNLENGIEW